MDVKTTESFYFSILYLFVYGKTRVWRRVRSSRQNKSHMGEKTRGSRHGSLKGNKSTMGNLRTPTRIREGTHKRVRGSPSRGWIKSEVVLSPPRASPLGKIREGTRRAEVPSAPFYFSPPNTHLSPAPGGMKPIPNPIPASVLLNCSLTPRRVGPKAVSWIAVNLCALFYCFFNWHQVEPLWYDKIVNNLIGQITFQIENPCDKWRNLVAAVAEFCAWSAAYK